MKVALLLLAVLACGLALPKYQGLEQHHDIKQHHVYEVLKYINNPLYHKEFLQIAHSFDLKSNADHYKHEVFEKFMEWYEHDRLLKRGEIFSIFNHEHMEQAKVLFELFYYADSYEVFHHTALWARHHLNEGLFMYSYSVAIVHRPDTHGLILPPSYELFPHNFFNADVIQKAYKLKMTHYNHGKEEAHHIIHANYSGFYLNLNPEQSLSYYLEDVGLNAFYFYYNIHFPYWMDSEEYQINHNRGELFYYLHKQLYARYYMERLSHGLGDIDNFNWDLPFKTGYYPSLVNTNGLPFPERPHFANLREYVHYYGQRLCDKNQNAFDYTYVQTYEQRIREAIDSGFVHDHEGNKHQLNSEKGINILGNIIEGNADSPNHHYYGSFVNTARHLLGYSKHPLNHHKLAPSVLEHLSTSLRDPAFYHIFKKVLTLIDQYKMNLPHYHLKHLHQPGLRIENVEFDQLITYYDHFFSDITNGLFVTPEEYEQDSFRVKVHQYRLNHKNFDYKIHVKSEKPTKVAVKLFLGPKYDEHGRTLKLSEIYDKIYQIDYFAHDLTVGDNIITRNSDDSQWFVKDLPTFFETYNKGFDSEHSRIFQRGFPSRFRLPRGNEAGLSFQVYVIVYPYVANEKTEQHQLMHGLHTENHIPYDTYPWGYPFDRPVEYEDVYYVPNAYVKHVKIYHEVNEEILHGDNHDSSMEHAHYDSDDDVMIYQRGDHNNYHRYHYDVKHDGDEHVDTVLHENTYTNNYKTGGFKAFFQDLTKKYPGLYKYTTSQVYDPEYKTYQTKYHGTKTGMYHDDQDYTYDDDKTVYKKQHVYDDENDYDQYKDRVMQDDEKHYATYKKHSINDQDHLSHPVHYTIGDEHYGQYQKHGSQYYEKTPYQAEENMKYGNNYNNKYNYDSMEHHGPMYHHY